MVVNKLDNFEIDKTYDFYTLGIGEPFALSCAQAKGIGEILDEIVKHFEDKNENDEANTFKIAVVGRPNAGKEKVQLLIKY